MQAGLVPLRLGISKARGRGRSTTFKCTCDQQSMNKGKDKVNTTKINRKQSPDTGIEPETSDMPGKRATFTPAGHLCFIMHYPTISAHR